MKCPKCKGKGRITSGDFHDSDARYCDCPQGIRLKSIVSGSIEESKENAVTEPAKENKRPAHPAADKFSDKFRRDMEC